MVKEIVFDTSIDINGLRKNLAEAEKAVLKYKKAYEEKRASLQTDSDALDELQAKVDALRAKVAEYKAILAQGASAGFEPYTEAYTNLPQAEAELARLEVALDKSIDSNIRQSESLEQTGVSLGTAEIKAREYGAALTQAEAEQRAFNDEIRKTQDRSIAFTRLKNGIKKLKPHIDMAHTGIGRLGRRILGLARRVFIFSMITMALRKVRSALSSMIKDNAEATASINQMKAALATLAQPIMELVIPAIIHLAQWVTTAASAIANLIATLTGRTFSDFTKKVKNLNETASGSGSGNKKFLASFDTVQTVGSNNGGGASSAVTDLAAEAAKLEAIELPQWLTDLIEVLGQFAGVAVEAGKGLVDNFIKPIADWISSSAIPQITQALQTLYNNVDWDGIITNLNDLWKGISQFVIGIGQGLIDFITKIIKSKVFASIIEGFAGVLGDLGRTLQDIDPDLIAAITETVSKFLALWVTYKAVKGIIVGIKGALSTFAGAVASLGILGIMAAVIGGILGMADAYITYQNKLQDRKEIEAFGDTVDNISKKIRNKIDTTNEEIDAIIKEKTETQKTSEAELKYADKLMEEYQKLRDKEDLTNDEKQRMWDLSNELIELYPDLFEKFKDEQGHLQISREEWNKLRESVLKEIQAEAAREKIQKLYEKQIELEEAQEEAIKNEKIAYEEYKKALNNATDASYLEFTAAWDLLYALQNNLTTVDNLTDAQQEIWDKYVGTEGSIYDLADAVTELSKDMTDAGREQNAAVSTASANWQRMKTDVELANKAVDENNTKITDFANKYIYNSEEVKDSAEKTANAVKEESKSIKSQVKEDAESTAKAVVNAQKTVENEAPKVAESAKTKIVKVWKSGFGDITRAAGEATGSLINSFNIAGNKINTFQSALGKMKNSNVNFSSVYIPRLATGAVIPPNREFMALLGDQKSGTNIEAPLDTIVEAFRTVMGDGGGQNVTVNFTGSMSQFVAMLDKEITISRRNRGV